MCVCWIRIFHPRAFAISYSDLPIATVISTNAPEIASLVPTYMILGVTSTPKFLASSDIFLKLGFEANAEVILFKLA